MDIPRASRFCTISRREFRPGETFFSVLTEEDGELIRQDIAAEHWQEPPPEVFGWWKTAAQPPAANKPAPLPNELLLQHFEQLVLQPDDPEMLYVLTLLLIRRKCLRYERDIAENGEKRIEVYSIQSGQTYQIPAAMPDCERLEAIQKELEKITDNKTA